MQRYLCELPYASGTVPVKLFDNGLVAKSDIAIFIGELSQHQRILRYSEVNLSD